MTTFNLDATRFNAELDRIKARYGPASEEAAVFIADEVMNRVLPRWPRDTNRSAAGWVEAANQAGLTQRQVPTIKKSIRHEWYIAALERQRDRALEYLRYWQRMQALYQRNDRTKQPYYRRKILPGLKFAEKRVAQAQEQLEGALRNDGFIIYDKGGFIYGDARYMKRHAIQHLTSVRTKFYGGKGRLLSGSGKAVVELTNMEPHARHIERVSRHGHPFMRSMMELRGTGMKKVGNKFVAGLETSLAQVG